jgi:hypothetical protein
MKLTGLQGRRRSARTVRGIQASDHWRAIQITGNRVCRASMHRQRGRKRDITRLLSMDTDLAAIDILRKIIMTVSKRGGLE